MQGKRKSEQFLFYCFVEGAREQSTTQHTAVSSNHKSALKANENNSIDHDSLGTQNSINIKFILFNFLSLLDVCNVSRIYNN